MLTARRLRELLSYDPETGEWIWLVSTSGVISVGQGAGNIGGNGYRQIQVDGKHYQSSRLAVLYMTGMWPVGLVDHKNTNKTDDRWENLRPATYVTNGGNRNANRGSFLGMKGVDRHKGRYRARIQVEKKRVLLGSFDTVDEAKAAYDKAAGELFGEYARA